MHSQINDCIGCNQPTLAVQATEIRIWGQAHAVRAWAWYWVPPHPHPWALPPLLDTRSTCMVAALANARHIQFSQALEEGPLCASLPKHHCNAGTGDVINRPIFPPQILAGIFFILPCHVLMHHHPQANGLSLEVLTDSLEVGVCFHREQDASWKKDTRQPSRPSSGGWGGF